MLYSCPRSRYLTRIIQYSSDTSVLIDCQSSFLLVHTIRSNARCSSFFLSLTFWGLASLSIVYAKGYPGLLVLRFAAFFHLAFKPHIQSRFDFRVLMGIGEAGYYAGMIYYLSFWYKRCALRFIIYTKIYLSNFS